MAAEQPFHEYEQRFFLAEIIKTSLVPPNELLRFIQEREILPRWNAMALPNGRSIDSCRANFDALQGFARPSIPVHGQLYDIGGAPSQSPLQNRRPSLGQGQGQRQQGGFGQPIHGHPGALGPLSYGQPPAGDLPLQARPSPPDPSMHPRFSQFATVNEPPTTPGAYQTGQDAQGYGSDKKTKKRGRPSKAENEIRAAEAYARGEPWPPLKKAKNPRTSAEGVPGDAEGVTTTVSKKIVSRTPKARQGPGATSGQAQAPAAHKIETASAGDTQSPEDEAPPAEDHPKSTIPETQASEFSAAERYPTGQAAQSVEAVQAQEDSEVPHTEPTQSETVQSSVTLP